MKTALVATTLALGIMLGTSAPGLAQYTFGTPSITQGQADTTNATPSQGR